MTILQIDIDTKQAISRQIINLEGQDYVLRFTWNNRDASWNMDILLPDGTEIIMGIKLTVNYELIGRYIQANVPKGILVLYSDDNVQYSRYQINESYFLIYITSDDEWFQ